MKAIATVTVSDEDHGLPNEPKEQEALGEQDSCHDSKMMPESMKVKAKVISPESKSNGLIKQSNGGKTRKSLVQMITQAIPSMFSPKKSANKYSSLKKGESLENQILAINVELKKDEESNNKHENGRTMLIKAPSLRNKSSVLRPPLEDQLDHNDEDPLGAFLQQFSQETGEIIVKRLTELMEEKHFTGEEDFMEAVKDILQELVDQGLIKQDISADSIDNLSVPFAKTIYYFHESKTLSKLSVADRLRSVMKTMSKRKSRFQHGRDSFKERVKDWTSLNLKLIPLQRKPPEAKPRDVFLLASESFEGFITIVLKEVELDSEHEKFKGILGRLLETCNLFFDPKLRDENYLMRDRLLYTPKIRLFIPKPRHHLVYFVGKYQPLQESKAYSLSKLFKPLKKIISAINIFSKRETKTTENSGVAEVIPVEISEKDTRNLWSLITKISLSISLKGFDPATISDRYLKSFNKMEDNKTNMKKLPSYFIDNLLEYCLLPSTYLNFDLGLYKRHVAVYENGLKLHYLTLMRNT